MSTSKQGFGIMDCIKSINRIQRWKMNAFCSLVGMFWLLSFAICIPGATGSGPDRHFQFRGRRLLAVIAISPPPANDIVEPVLSPSPSPPNYPPPVPPPPPTYLPPPVMASPPILPPAPLSPPAIPPSPPPPPPPPILPPPPMIPPAPITPPPPTADPPSSPPFESLGPSGAPPVEPTPPPTPSTIVSPGSSTWNESEKAGVVIAAIAALLQVAVVAFLLIKRHQMLRTVEYEDFDEDSDNSDPVYSHREDSA